jgi:hypothetical protein
MPCSPPISRPTPAASCASFASKGDRVAIGMTGKFLPFKYYGAKGNELAVGLKEE